jgi:hypothetical protein
MANTAEVIEALDQIQKTNIDSIVVSFLIAAVALMLLKIVAEAIAGYIQLRLDQNIAIGSPVEVYGKKGRINHISIFTVTVETDCGFIRIPTKSWRVSRFIALKDRLELRNRRKDDT